MALVMTVFFGLHLFLRRKMDFCGHNELFFSIFWSSLVFGICGHDDLFFVFTCFWTEKWTSADMMTLKEPVLFLHIENMVTLRNSNSTVAYFSKLKKNRITIFS